MFGKPQERRSALENQVGMATVLALLMVGLLTFIGLMALSTSDDEVSIAGNELHDLKAFYAAEAGLEKAAAVIEYTYEQTGIPPSVLPAGQETVNNCVVKYWTTDDGPIVQKKLSTGVMAGLSGQIKTYTMTSLATDIADRTSIEMSQSFEAILIPLFQFAVFYEGDLLATPKYAMTIGGRVHVNGNMWVQASDKLIFDGKLSVGGNIRHGLPDGINAGANGDVFLEHQTGLLQNMYDGIKWLDASDADWYNEAQLRWGGNVQDQAFGQETLSLPLSGSGDPHKIIERASGNPDSYESRATFKILDGVPLAKIGGVWQNIDGFLPAGTVTNTSFFDQRENKTVNTTQIDMDKLAKSGYFPTNGVLYTSDQRSGFNGTRLVSGTDIGYPLSVVSENPVYIQGDFNTTKKQPAAVIADAITFLSNSWNDAQSSQSLSNRIPDPTLVNLSIMSGDVEPTSTNYGGGLENLPRFLEDWNSTKFSINGSMNCMWKSTQAKGTWSYGNYYTAPTRDWKFDTDLNDPNKLPPESPSIEIFQRTGWVQKYVGFMEIDTLALDTANWIY